MLDQLSKLKAKHVEEIENACKESKKEINQEALREEVRKQFAENNWFIDIINVGFGIVKKFFP